MEPDPKNVRYAPDGLTALAQPVSAPLTRAAIFLVVTLKPGAESRTAARSFCADLAALTRAVETRDLEAGLSCIMGIGSEAWDRLFGAPRPAMLHPFREIRAGERHAVSTPGDLLFHIRAKRMDLCFELATQIMARIGDAVTPADEVHGFHYFDDRDLIGFVDGTENPRGQAAVDAVLDRRGGRRVRRRQLRHRAEISARSGRMECAAPPKRRNESSAARNCRTLNWTSPLSQAQRTTHSPRSSRTGKRSRSCATTCPSAGRRKGNLERISSATAVRQARSS